VNTTNPVPGTETAPRPAAVRSGRARQGELRRWPPGRFCASRVIARARLPAHARPRRIGIPCGDARLTALIRQQFLEARRDRWRGAAGTGLVLVAFVVLGFCLNTAVRMPCHDVCGLDIGRMYEDHHIDRAHPPYLSRDLEYPPLIGEVMYAAHAPFAHGLRGPFIDNMVLLTALAAVTTWMLWRRDGKRTWRWALAPPLLIQGLQNWDLLAVAPATIGLIQWENGAAFVAGFLLGTGAAAKLFPAMFVPILAAASWYRGQRRQSARVVAGAATGFAVFVLPVYAVVPSALSYFVRFHGDRGPDRGAIWYFVFHGPARDAWFSGHGVVDFITIVPSVLLVAALVALTVFAGRGRITPFGACALATIAFLVTSKVYSPQYDLWIVPFFVLLPVRTKHVVNFYVASFAVFVLTASDDHVLHRPASGYLLGLAVVYRLVVYALVTRDILRTETRDASEPAGAAVIDLRDDAPAPSQVRRV